MAKWFDNWIQKRYEKRSTLVGEPWMWLSEAPGTKANSGQTVSAETALNVTSVYSCVRLISETIASLPLVLYKKTEYGKELADSHPLYDIIHDKPNEYQTSFEFREMIVGHLLLRGNSYCFIERSAKRVKQLIPLNPTKMVVKRLNGNIIYIYTHEDGREEKFKNSEIWHVRGMSSDGLVGLSPVSVAREAIGLAMAAEEYESRVFENDSRPSGILSVQGRLDKEAQSNLKNSWQAAFTGKNRHKVAVLEEGMTWTSIGMSNNDIQFLELRKFQTIEICRIFRVPPHLIFDLDRATFSNIEEQGMEFIQYSLLPWLVRIEQSMNNTLLTPVDRKNYFTSHKIEGLLRGNTTSRYSAYSTALNNGIMSINEVRSLENMNPIENGDKYLVPLNLTTIEKAGQNVATESKPPEPFGAQTQDNTGEKTNDK